MNTPVREMFVTYSWMNASNDSNSLLIVTRSSPRLSESLMLARLPLTCPKRSNCSRWYSVRDVTWMRRM